MQATDSTDMNVVTKDYVSKFKSKSYMVKIQVSEVSTCIFTDMNIDVFVHTDCRVFIFYHFLETGNICIIGDKDYSCNLSYAVGNAFQDGKNFSY